MGGFLAKKYRSALQEQRGLERYDLSVGRRISRREIETQRESRRIFPRGKSRLRGSLKENFQEKSRDPEGVKEKTKENTTKELCDTLTTLYQGTSIKRKMLLKNQLQLYQMQKGEQINHFLSRLQGIRDQLTSIGATPDQELMVRTTLNAVFEEWETFVQRILGRANLPDWEELWAALHQEEIRRLSKAGVGPQNSPYSHSIIHQYLHITSILPSCHLHSTSTSLHLPHHWVITMLFQSLLILNILKWMYG